jgi:hypothetical protein
MGVVRVTVPPLTGRRFKLKRNREKGRSTLIHKYSPVPKRPSFSLVRISYIRKLANIETCERVHVTRRSQPLNRARRRSGWSSGDTGGWRGGRVRAVAGAADAPRTMAAPRRTPVKAAPTLGGAGPRCGGTSSVIPGGTTAASLDLARSGLG